MKEEVRWRRALALRLVLNVVQYIGNLRVAQGLERDGPWVPQSHPPHQAERMDDETGPDAMEDVMTKQDTIINQETSPFIKMEEEGPIKGEGMDDGPTLTPGLPDDEVERLRQLAPNHISFTAPPSPRRRKQSAMSVESLVDIEGVDEDGLESLRWAYPRQTPDPSTSPPLPLSPEDTGEEDLVDGVRHVLEDHISPGICRR